MDWTYDKDPLTLSEAGACVNELVKDFNSHYGRYHGSCDSDRDVE